MSIYQIVLKAADNNHNQYRNVHYYEFFNYVPTSTQLQEAVDAIDTAYKSNLQSSLSDDFSFEAYDVRRVDIGDLPTVEYQATAGAWDGTNTSAQLPHQVSALCTFKAQTTFPRTARTYLFGFVEDANNAGGRVEASVLSQISDWADDMLELTITGDLNADKQAVQFGGTPRAVTDSNDLETHSERNNWATQRRRRSGVGI